MLTLMSQHSCFTTKEAEIKDKLPTFFNFCTLSTYALSFFLNPEQVRSRSIVSRKPLHAFVNTNTVGDGWLVYQLQ